MKKIFSSGALINETPKMLDWVKERGFESSRTRYNKYVEHITNFFTCAEPWSLDALEKFKISTDSFKELWSLYDIYSSFREEVHEGFIDRLEKVIGGQEHPERSSAGPSRDYLFELATAAICVNAGYRIDFGARTDVVAEDEKYSIHIECKRLSSETKFESNFKEAGKQLRGKNENPNKTNYGMIFIDITNCLAGLPTAEVESPDAARAIVCDAANKFVEQNDRKIDSINKRFLESSLGVCLLTQTPVWTRDAALFMVRSVKIHVARELPDRQFSDLETIAKRLFPE